MSIQDSQRGSAVINALKSDAIVTVSKEYLELGIDSLLESGVLKEADSSTRCNKDEPGDGWLRMSMHHGHSNRQVQVARCTSTSAEKNDTKFTAS